MAAALRHRPAYSALELPRPGRSALVFAALAVTALALDAAPRLPWTAGVLAAALFAAAGATRTVQERRELAAVRRTADRLIVHASTGRDASELVRWRCAELTARSERERLRREVCHTLHELEPGLLPSASPLRRPAARRCTDLLTRLERRLSDERPVSARGILLAQALLRDAGSPLYTEETEELLGPALRRLLGALEP